jgi:putative PIN family toxin of toxin-antitoxin system
VKVVLDTNVVVSGVFFGGPPREVIEAWLEGQLHIVITPNILDEYLQVCQRLGNRYPGTDFSPLLAEFVSRGSLISDQEDDQAISTDPDDDKFMRCALKAEAAVVSGDRHLLDADGWRGVRVLTPRFLLEVLPRQG